MFKRKQNRKKSQQHVRRLTEIKGSKETRKTQYPYLHMQAKAC